MFPQAIRFHFDTPITQVNLHRQTVHASTAGSIATQVRCEGNSLSCSMLITEACSPSCKKVRQTQSGSSFQSAGRVPCFRYTESLMFQEVSYDLLVGADGAGSVVRSALQQIMPAHYLRRYRHNQVYSMKDVTPSDPGQIPSHAVFQAHPTKVGLTANRSMMLCHQDQSITIMTIAVRRACAESMIACESQDRLHLAY